MTVLGSGEAADLVKAKSVLLESNGRHHHGPEALRAALVDEGIRKIDDFTSRYNCAIVDFDGDPDPFTNLNTPADLATAETLLGG